MATASGDNKELVSQIISGKMAKGDPLGKKEFSAVVMGGFKSQMEEALPAHLKANAEKYARQAITLFSQNPALQKCAPVTILTALMSASAMGLDLSPQLGQCYIIPYLNSKKDGRGWAKVWEAQFQIGYRGIISLAQRSGAVARIHADVVRQKDKFRYSKGLCPALEHEESWEEDRGAITHVYAVANFTNGGYAFEVWPVGKVAEHAKKFSQSYYRDEYQDGRKTGRKIENAASPWVKDFESMAKKTLIRAIWKYMPVSTEMMLAVASDESIRSDVRGLGDEKDILRIPQQQDEEGEGWDAPALDAELRAEPEPAPDPAPEPAPDPKPAPAPAAPAAEAKPAPDSPPPASQTDCRRIWQAYLAEFGQDKEKAKAAADAVTGGRPSKEWTAADIEAMGRSLGKLKAGRLAALGAKAAAAPAAGSQAELPLPPDPELAEAMQEAAAFL
jgi:recombination protein RecT